MCIRDSRKTGPYEKEIIGLFPDAEVLFADGGKIDIVFDDNPAREVRIEQFGQIDELMVAAFERNMFLVIAHGGSGQDDFSYLLRRNFIL